MTATTERKRAKARPDKRAFLIFLLRLVYYILKYEWQRKLLKDLNSSQPNSQFLHNKPWIIWNELRGKDMRAVKSLLATGLLALSLGIVSQGPASAEKVLEGGVCSTRVHQLTTNIKWYSNLDEAENAAREQNKLVFWMHMLGKIDGAT
jgi:hypothetical protein